MAQHGRVSFGKHAGKRWEDVPSDYLDWCFAKFTKGSHAWHLVHDEILRRTRRAARKIVPALDAQQLRPKGTKQAKRQKLLFEKREKEHCGANWQHPLVPALPRKDRDRLFEELVDTSRGTVRYVEDFLALVSEKYENLLPPPNVITKFPSYPSEEKKQEALARLRARYGAPQ